MTDSGKEVTPSTCAEVEEMFDWTGKKGAYYRRFFPGCECERHKVSRHSPGVVKCGEMLLRLAIPGHVGVNQATGVRAFKQEALRGVDALGLSVIRLGHASESLVKSKAAEFAENKGVFSSEVLFGISRCADIRSICEDGRQVYSIIDSATQNDPTHADIHRDFAFPPGTKDQRAVYTRFRRTLSSVFTIYDSLSEPFR